MLILIKLISYVEHRKNCGDFLAPQFGDQMSSNIDMSTNCYYIAIISDVQVFCKLRIKKTQCLDDRLAFIIKSIIYSFKTVTQLSLP
jgi:hypothetical protein